MISLSDWGHGSIGRAPAYKCKALSSNPSTTKKKKGKDLDIIGYIGCQN
jgi:hypothetical protein